MKVIAGLGNPGPKYEKTRHNIGFMIVDRFAESIGQSLKKNGYSGLYVIGVAEGEQVLLLKPQTFMNLSGDSVVGAMKGQKLSADSLIVIHDDLDLPLGRLRIRVEGGHGGHNGIRDIIAKSGTNAFVRLKVGIGRPKGEAQGGGDVTSHVLGPFTSGERITLERVIETGCDAIREMLRSGPVSAMNSFNNLVVE